jgi:curved DNA-binding protein CbpA
VLTASMREHGVVGKGPLVGIVHGAAWSFAFVTIGLVAAVQQMVFGAINTALHARHFLLGSGQWDDVARAFASPPLPMASHTVLDSAPADAVLRDLAMRRNMKSKKKSQATASGAGDEEASNDAKKRKKEQGSKAGGVGGGGVDLYATLGLEKNATEKAIKEAYNRLALSLHPDRNPSKDAHIKFDAVTKAYRVLSNKEKRRKYDAGGHEGLEDAGVKQRATIRAMLGGDEVVRFAGDVRTNPVFLRLVDRLEFLPHEAAVIRLRMLRACVAELLSYLDGYSDGGSAGGGETPGDPSHQPGTSSPRPANTAGDHNQPEAPATSSSREEAVEKWLENVKRRVAKFTNIALAREVLLVVGHEYRRVVLFVTANPASRVASLVTDVGPHRMKVRLSACAALSKVSTKAARDTQLLLDIGWKFIVMDLEANARAVALATLLDGDADAAEKRRRLSALDRLSGLFIANGKEYAGASKEMMDRVLESLKEYQKSRAAAKDEADRREE